LEGRIKVRVVPLGFYPHLSQEREREIAKRIFESWLRALYSK